VRAKRALNFLSQISEFWKKSSNWRDICTALLECKQTFTKFFFLAKTCWDTRLFGFSRQKSTRFARDFYEMCDAGDFSSFKWLSLFFHTENPSSSTTGDKAIHHIFTSAWDHMEKKKSSIVVRGKSEKRKELLETAKTRKREADKNPDIHQKLSMNIWYASLHFIHRP